MTHSVTTSEAGVLSLLAPVSGIVVPLDDVPDDAFAQRLAGDGVAIDPLSDEVLAPCDATVLQVHRASHALTLSANGLEILIHVGLDTVALKGEGFTMLVRAGDAVTAGTPLISFDPDLIARRARSLLTEIIVTNVDRVAKLECATGTVLAGRDAVMHVTTRGTAQPHAATPSGDVVQAGPVRVGSAMGLHARPAGTIASAARRYTSDIRLTKGERQANARSVVDIMALEALGGDVIVVRAQGRDALVAVAEIVSLLGADLDASQEVAAHRNGMRAAPARAVASPEAAPQDDVLRGVPASPGIAAGSVFHLTHDEHVPDHRAADPAAEQHALETAIEAARLQLDTLRARLTSDADAERAAIFTAHEELLDDPELLDRALAGIRTGENAAFAWHASYAAQAARLMGLRNEMLAARATDLRDVGRRVLKLLVKQESGPVDVPADSVVIAEDLTPSDAATLDRTRVRGFCTTSGSATSHVAILARGLGIPAVAGMDPRVLSIESGTRVVLDGSTGTLRVGVTAAQESEVASRQASDEIRRTTELSAAQDPATTRDGHRIEVVANIGAEADAPRVMEVGGEGVGLLRTEFLFMDRDAAPTESEQARVYEEIARTLGRDRILVIRTLDVGGDKPLSYVPVAHEENPFLGERGIRLALARPELLRCQVRAILRAASSGKLAMMFPMVATLAEWRAARAMVEREREALGASEIPVGVMVETASAALMAERFAREADFLSIGTNDLTQYTLAMDRTNPRLAPQVDAMHPAVLKLIAETVKGARAWKRWVGVCGALAGDLEAVPVLLGLGVNELSADVPLVPAVKARVRTLSMEECRATAQAALEAADGAEVRAIVAQRHG